MHLVALAEDYHAALARDATQAHATQVAMTAMYRVEIAMYVTVHFAITVGYRATILSVRNVLITANARMNATTDGYGAATNLVRNATMMATVPMLLTALTDMSRAPILSARNVSQTANVPMIAT